jgi:hypothetical protein
MHGLTDRVQPNAAVEKLFAKHLGVPKSAVRVVTGGKKRLKGLEIDGPPRQADVLAGMMRE